jgi:hypothetical protein
MAYIELSVHKAIQPLNSSVSRLRITSLINGCDGSLGRILAGPASCLSIRHACSAVQHPGCCCNCTDLFSRQVNRPAATAGRFPAYADLLLQLRSTALPISELKAWRPPGFFAYRLTLSAFQKQSYHTQGILVTVAAKFGLQPETILWANQDLINDHLHNFRSGLLLPSCL